MEWNKLEVRELTKEEQEEYGYKSMWDGLMPELDEEVLVTYPIGHGRYAPTDIDTWIEFDKGDYGNNKYFSVNSFRDFII